MRRLLTGFLVALAVTACAAPERIDESAITSAIADPTRPEEHRARDNSRRPAAVLRLGGFARGQRVAELAAGSGYYAALLARVVGQSGKVYAVDPGLIFKAFPNASDTFPNYAASDPQSNIEYFVAPRLDELSFPEPLDRVMMALYYHDTIWTGEDRAKMNRQIYNALKPGGRYIVIDHHAQHNATEAVTQTLHRTRAEPVRLEIEAAGFRLLSDSGVLANPNDPRDGSVFAEDVRGKTDRFLYVFEKPSR